MSSHYIWKRIKRNRYVILNSIFFGTLVLSIAFVISFTIPQIITKHTYTEAQECHIIDGVVKRLPLEKAAWAPQFTLRYVTLDGHQESSSDGRYRAEWQGSKLQAKKVLENALKAQSVPCYYKVDGNAQAPVYLKVSFSAEAIVGIIAFLLTSLSLVMAIFVKLADYCNNRRKQASQTHQSLSLRPNIN